MKNIIEAFITVLSNALKHLSVLYTILITIMKIDLKIKHTNRISKK